VGRGVGSGVGPGVGLGVGAAESDGSAALPLGTGDSGLAAGDDSAGVSAMPLDGDGGGD
jgi:hypothetical protein